jgi:hypothetical protein
MTREMPRKRYNELSVQERFLYYGIVDENLQKRLENPMKRIEEKGAAFALKEAYYGKEEKSVLKIDLNTIVKKLLNNTPLTPEEEKIAYDNKEEIEKKLEEEW